MYLANARVLDLVDGTLSEPLQLNIRDGVIAGLSTDPPEGTNVINLGGRVVVPGLIACHTHFSIVHPLSNADESESLATTAVRSTVRAKEAVYAGVTTVRTVHEVNRVDLFLREQVAAEGFVLPRIIPGGRALSHVDGHGKAQGCAYAENPDEFYAAAIAELEAGATHLKIFITGGIARPEEVPGQSEMTPEEIGAVVAAAREHGTYVTAHAGGSKPISVALERGVMCFEHAYELDTETAQQMAEAGATLSATLGVTHSPEYKRFRNFGEASIVKSAGMAPTHLSSVTRAVQAGVRIVNGTDFPPGDPSDGTTTVVREMELLAKTGMSPLECLRASTINGAELCNIADITGSIALKKSADLIVIDENPLEGLHHMRNQRVVIAAGTIVRNEL